MPPHSIVEWMVGRNITPRTFGSSSKRDVVKVAVSTDDETESNTLSVTYPRTSTSRAKKVRFHQAPPRRSILKQCTGNSSSDTLIGGNSGISDVESDTQDHDAESSYQGDTTDSSSHVTRAKRTTKVKTHRRIRTSDLESSTDDEADDSPHPTCDCAECIAGRRKLKIAKKRQKTADTSDDDEADGSEESKANRKSKLKQQKKKGKKGRLTQVEATISEESGEDDDTDAEVSDEPEIRKSKKSNSENKTASRGQGKNNLTNSKGKGGRKTANIAEASDYDLLESLDDQAKITNTKATKDSADLPEPADSSTLRAPRLIMPITAKVLQVEHAVETPDDPRPNAFVDQQHGIVRVYHGPAYGNPYGSLYPRRTWSDQVLPVGVPHPLNNLYFNGFRAPVEQSTPSAAPGATWPQTTGAFQWPSTSFPQATFPSTPGIPAYDNSNFPPQSQPQVAGMTDEQAAAAVAQGIGLTGLPPHPISIPASNPFPWERDGKRNLDPWSENKDKTSEVANNVGPDWMNIDPSKTFCAPQLPGSAEGGSQNSNQSKQSNDAGKYQKGAKEAWSSSTYGGTGFWGNKDNNENTNNQNGNERWGAVGNNNNTDGRWASGGSQHGSVSGGNHSNGNKPSPEFPSSGKPADTGKGGENTPGPGSNDFDNNNSGGWSGNAGGENQNWASGSNRGSNNGNWDPGNGGFNDYNSSVEQGSHRGSDSGRNNWTTGSSSMPGAWGGSQNGSTSRQTSGGWDNSNNVGGWNSGISNHHNSLRDQSQHSGSNHGSNSGNEAWGGPSSPQNDNDWGNDNTQNNDGPAPAWADPSLAQSTQGPGFTSKNW